ncbi:MAG: hypothetical protein K2L38_09150, partial [Dysosmobacter sp.]|nr:hypothetical protein [Dysosmobacter sp.]
AYISNNYLSTTKPVVQQQTSKPSGGQQQQQQQQTQQQQQQTPPQQTSSGSDMSISEIEQIMKEQLIKDREALKAEGWNGREGNALTDEDIEAIGTMLNGG